MFKIKCRCLKTYLCWWKNCFFFIFVWCKVLFLKGCTVAAAHCKFTLFNKDHIKINHQINICISNPFGYAGPHGHMHWCNNHWSTLEGSASAYSLRRACDSTPGGMTNSNLIKIISFIYELGWKWFSYENCSSKWEPQLYSFFIFLFKSYSSTTQNYIVIGLVESYSFT